MPSLRRFSDWINTLWATRGGQAGGEPLKAVTNAGSEDLPQRATKQLIFARMKERAGQPPCTPFDIETSAWKYNIITPRLKSRSSKLRPRLPVWTDHMKPLKSKLAKTVERRGIGSTAAVLKGALNLESENLETGLFFVLAKVSCLLVHISSETDCKETLQTNTDTRLKHLRTFKIFIDRNIYTVETLWICIRHCTQISSVKRNARRWCMQRQTLD